MQEYEKTIIKLQVHNKAISIYTSKKLDVIFGLVMSNLKLVSYMFILGRPKIDSHLFFPNTNP